MCEQNFYRTDSVGLFKHFWFLWKILGIQTFPNKWISRFYDAVLNVFITILYPVHLTAGLVLLPMHTEIFKNLSMTITCIVCSFKHYSLRWKLQQMHRVEELFRRLDKRSQTNEELTYFNEGPKKEVDRMAKMYFSIYMGANLAAIISVLLDSDWRLMYPAWMPFDWRASKILYWLALLYQFVGVTIQIVQNLVNDAAAPVCLCLLGGHVRLLSMRVSRLGYERKRTNAENKNDLKLCVQDHKTLLELFNLLEDSLSMVQIILFLSSGLNICVVLVYLIFYVDSMLAYLYYSVFTIALGIELFPCYYYGSLLEQEFDELPYAIFCSNWIEQTKGYRKEVLIFVEATLRQLTMLGGGIIRIRLESFFAILKTAYSLFALVLRIK